MSQRSRWSILLLLGAFAIHPALASGQETSWDVTAQRGPTSQVSFTVREGTWMSLDVSPDGRRIVFDLLGDIYTMPITGGEATRVLGGPAWEMQPRWSPDGQRILFTSDRGGGDNIWTAAADGTDLRAVTTETFRLLNSAAWSPDGDWVAARKHFTSGRSLGAGEIWLYHRSGGSGVRLTERRTQEKDTGEPVFSPDGRYIYYSEDSTPGGTFAYNKDPNGQIYVIRRLELATGEIEDLITGPGGAARPTPAPDGRTIAFVRRIRLKTVLCLYDVESGAVRPLWDGLDRDMQETWAIHGVYPTFDWTPDGSALVVWAGGDFHRIEVATGRERPLPFRAEVTQQVTDAVRFQQEVAPDTFPVRMLRWVTVSPDGRRVAYSALGHVWVKDLPSGQPHRLTDSEQLEFYPSWSPDSSALSYVTWDDQLLGAVWVAPLTGGTPRKITRDPGHYVEPAFTPDGGSVLYRRVAGGYLTSPTWSADPGIYRQTLSGGPPSLVSKSGQQAHFGAERDRVYLMDNEGGRRALVSMTLDGHDRRVHVTSENAVALRVSPDSEWVAYSERFEVNVIAFPRTGIPFEVGPGTAPVPVHQVSRDAGFNLHWGGDSTTLYWSLGPDLYRRLLTDTFAFLDGSPSPLPAPEAEGTPIGFDQPYDRPEGVIAFTGARILTMDGDRVIDDGTIVIEGNRITAVGPASQVTVPSGARTIDATGKTIMPGMIDAHAHMGAAENGIVPEQNWGYYANLAFGVTTMHDPSNDTEEVFTASEMEKAGVITGPRQFSTGTILYGAEGDFKAVINSLDDARSHLRRMKAVGAFSVKSYNQPRRDQRQQIIQAARELQMMVVPEGGSLYHHNMTMVMDGHTGIEHALPVAHLYDDALTLLSRSRTGYTPTLVVAYGGIWGENYWYQHTDVWKDERLLTFVPRDVVDPRARRRMSIPEDDFNHIDVAAGAAEVLRRGGMVQLGAHGQMQGLGAHWELWSFVQGGMTPMQALQTATIGGARYLGLDGDLGSLEAGKLADLVIFEADPLSDIRNSEQIGMVMVNGRLYDARTMDRIAGAPVKRERFFFEGGR